MVKCALVCGAGGFIGGHLVKRLKQDGFWVRGVDLKFPEFSETEADDFVVGDLRDQSFCRAIVDRRFDEVYQLAADMGGAGYIFTGEHDADLMHNSATINLNMLDACRKRGTRKIFYSSSACMYPAYNQEDPVNPKCAEDSAYPAAPDSEYGWEKLFSERLYLAYRRNYGMQTLCRPLPQHLWSGRHLDRGARKGAGRHLPQGRHGARRRRHRDLGRWRADALVSLYRRMRRRHGAAAAVKFCRAGQHRIGGNGHDQPTGRSRGDDCRQADRQKAYSRTARSCAGATPTTG